MLKGLVLFTLLFSTPSFAQKLLGSIASEDKNKSVTIFQVGEGSVTLKIGNWLQSWVVAEISFNQVKLCRQYSCIALRPGDYVDGGFPVSTNQENTGIKVEEKNKTIKITKDAKDKIITKELANILMQAASQLVYNEDKELIGIEIFDIDQGSIYETFGLQDGDVITQLDGIPVTNLSETVKHLKSLQEAPSLNFTILRDGIEQVFTLDVLNNEIPL